MTDKNKHTNRLINETSPYLLQHAHNPVDWFPWGEEAFEKARAEDKPVLVSIGYSACHWCHVMEHESFEDEAAAAIMNEHFISIKVDMEERPDVDQIYMTFVQMTTGRGGWPMNVFLTPDKRPFFGGTYFPPQPRYQMPSWPQILTSIAEAWKEKRDELLASADNIVGELKRIASAELSSSGNAVSEALSDKAFQSFVRSFDARNGGFGGAPKFPAAMAMDFLLRYWKRTGNINALDMVRHTARKMAEGGIYDQLGGGFHRYSVDAVWLVPHFEKMLYDNAQLARIYLHLFQVESGVVSLGSGVENAESGAGGSAQDSRLQTPDFFKRVAVEILDYIKREMLDVSGGFYSTQDADSEGEEGKFFVWTPDEVKAVLGAEDAAIFNFYFDVSDDGNFEGKNILNIKLSEAETCEALKITPERLAEVIERGKKLLFEEREKRIKPFRDEKVLTAWNGLMLAAFAEASVVLNEPAYLDIAKRNADFLISELLAEGRVLRTWKDGRAKLNGYIEDYANLADGLLELYQAGGDISYYDEAKRLADVMITEFWDADNGGFFFTSNDHEELIVRNKDLYDNATPSGNSVAADVLLKLAKLSGDERYERFAVTILRLAAAQVERHPQGFGRALAAMEFLHSPVKEIALIGDKANEMREAVFAEYRPFKVVASGDAASERPELLKDREAVDGKPTAYVCESFVCQRPVTTTEELKELL
ncbi:MAG: thioredoxin domain-containing protein [Acidobacteria bacterium]|nr:thioredoxin domain-containing protein [Acidobacteriota bacterium]